ncbi:MAG: hypothetical protein L0229_11960 [Blastocatellia bacterium]|nr:hypothetical protein [Blastocatellia bacterium]
MSDDLPLVQLGAVLAPAYRIGSASPGRGRVKEYFLKEYFLRAPARPVRFAQKESRLPRAR